MDNKRRMASDTEELIFLCARMEHDDGTLSRASGLISGGINWDIFKGCFLQSELYFLFYNSLKAISRKAEVPSGILDSLKDSYLYAVSVMSAQYKETSDILKLFFDKNIPAVPLKGPFLARRLYGDVAARGVSTDIDLLVDAKRMDEAADILGLAGYVCAGGRMRDIFGQRSFSKKGCHVVDLQWQISPVVANDERMAGFWNGVTLRREKDTSYYDFREEELLLQLATHFVDSSHLMELKHICDIHELLAKYGDALDWDSVMDKAFRWRLSGSLYTALLFSGRLFGLSAPPAVMKSLDPGAANTGIIYYLTKRHPAFWRKTTSAIIPGYSIRKA